MYDGSMGLTELIAEAEREVAAAEDALVAARADAAAAVARLTSLRGAVEPAGDLGSLSRTDAIMAVLGRAGGPLQTGEIIEAMVMGGREADSPNEVTATLAYLIKQGRAVRVGRGIYAPT